MDRHIDGDFIHTAPSVATLHLVGFLEGHHGVGPIGNGSAGHDSDGRPRTHRLGGQRSGGHYPDNLERHRRLSRSTLEVGGLHCVAVHSRVVHRRDVESRGHVLGQNLAHGVEDRLLLNVQNVEISEDAFQRLLHAQHGLIIVVSVRVSVLCHGAFSNRGIRWSDFQVSGWAFGCRQACRTICNEYTPQPSIRRLTARGNACRTSESSKLSILHRSWGRIRRFSFLKRFLSIVVVSFLQDDTLLMVDASVGCCD